MFIVRSAGAGSLMRRMQGVYSCPPVCSVQGVVKGSIIAL
jgi:hypothetical protein